MYLSGSRGAYNVSSGVLGFLCQRYEFILIKRRLPITSIERLTHREVVKITARDKYPSYSTWEGGMANIMVARRVSIGDYLFRFTYHRRTFSLHRHIPKHFKSPIQIFLRYVAPVLYDARVGMIYY